MPVAGRHRAACAQELLRQAVGGDDIARWAQCLARIVKHAAPLCPAALRCSCVEVGMRLQVRCGGCSGPVHLPCSDGESIGLYSCSRLAPDQAQSPGS